ncbi:group 1 truncated hemoglobin [Micromonospora sp. NPDC050397]|uniref:group I truncated hemoglobin n=1 Tax=Micromonospora sp. NPDC050397 TaxID=3364279 RepID=UPI00384E9992
MTETRAEAFSSGDTGAPDRDVPVPGSGGESAYERIGGAEAVQAAVRLFYERVLADPDLGGYFETVEMAGQRRHLALMLTMLLGGPDTYSGRGLADAHRGLNIPRVHYAKVGGHLLGTLVELDVPPDVVHQVRVLLDQVEPQVVAGRVDPV